MEKDIEYYMSLPYTVQVTRVADETGAYYFAKVEELPGCHTDGATPAEAVTELEQVKRDYLEVKLEMGAAIPEPEDLPSGRFGVRVPKTLHRQLITTAKSENISLNALIVYLLTQATASTREEAATMQSDKALA